MGETETKAIMCAAMLCHKCSTEIQTEDSSSLEHLRAYFFLRTVMPCYSEGKWLDVGSFPDIMP